MRNIKNQENGSIEVLPIAKSIRNIITGTLATLKPYRTFRNHQEMNANNEHNFFSLLWRRQLFPMRFQFSFQGGLQSVRLASINVWGGWGLHKSEWQGFIVVVVQKIEGGAGGQAPGTHMEYSFSVSWPLSTVVRDKFSSVFEKEREREREKERFLKLNPTAVPFPTLNPPSYSLLSKLQGRKLEQICEELSRNQRGTIANQ